MNLTSDNPVESEIVDWLRRFTAADTDDKLRAIAAEDAPPGIDVDRLSDNLYLVPVLLGRVQGKLAYLLGEPLRVPSDTGWPS